MNITQLADTLRSTFEYNLTTKRHEDKITPMVWGPPGVGKSDIVYQLADELGYKVVELRLSSMNPVDVRGFPYLDSNTGKGQFALPYYFPDSAENPRIIIFLDEINTAPPINQVTAYELCQNYPIGGKKLPQETLIIAAGNREDDGGATFEMPTPLANRFQHLYVLPSKKVFVEYGIKKGLMEEIIGFINFKPTFLHRMDTNGKAFPTPRSWEKLSNLLKYRKDFDSNTVSSLVGEGAAGEFLAYVKVKSSLPDINKILQEGTSFSSPNRSLMFSFVTSLTYRINTEPTAEKLKNYIKIIETLTPELQVVAIHMVSKEVIAFAVEEVPDEFFSLVEKFSD